MNFLEVYSTFFGKGLLVFTWEDFRAFYPTVNKKNQSKNFSRWEKNGWIERLRKGVYEFIFPKDLAIPDLYLANKIYAPSYVSLETALSHYGLIPEVAMAVTSITSKTTRRFKNRHGLFLYRTVQPKAFCGYTVEQEGAYDILIAEPEKAVVDYLYFNSVQGKFDVEAIRLDMKRVKQLNMKKMNNYAALYGLNWKELCHVKS